MPCKYRRGDRVKVIQGTNERILYGTISRYFGDGYYRVKVDASGHYLFPTRCISFDVMPESEVG